MQVTNDGTEIRRELYKSYLALVRTLYQQSRPQLTTPNLSANQRRFLIGSIVFLAFAMESFINDFGERLVDEFEDFERMETINKFFLFPKITRMNSHALMRKDDGNYSALKELFKYRDCFAHYKPAFRRSTTSQERIYESVNHANVSRLYTSMVRLLKLINREFNVFDGDNDWIGIYSEDITAGT